MSTLIALLRFIAMKGKLPKFAEKTQLIINLSKII
jgi:hypothetical protein